MRHPHLLALAALAFTGVLVYAGSNQAAVRHTQEVALFNCNSIVETRCFTVTKALESRGRANYIRVGFNKSNDQVVRQHKHRKTINNADQSVRQMVADAAREHGVPVEFALAVAQQESGFRCNAVSSAGAMGVMQIKRATAAGEGYTGSARGLLDCKTGIEYGMRYLKRAISVASGDLCTAAHLYYSGVYAKRMTGDGRNYCGQVMKKKKQILSSSEE